MECCTCRNHSFLDMSSNSLRLLALFLVDPDDPSKTVRTFSFLKHQQIRVDCLCRMKVNCRWNPPSQNQYQQMRVPTVGRLRFQLRSLISVKDKQIPERRGLRPVGSLGRSPSMDHVRKWKGEVDYSNVWLVVALQLPSGSRESLADALVGISEGVSCVTKRTTNGEW